MRTVDSSKSLTYRVEMTYRYVVGDRPYVGNRYKFVEMSSSGYGGKAAIVEALGPGTRTTCWINPENPADAVIERGPTVELWFALIPLVFVAFSGAGMLFIAAAGRGQSGGLTPTTTAATFTKAVRGAESTTLRPKSSRGGALVGFIVIVVFWNGIVSVFLYDVVRQARGGTIPWFTALFLTPFVLIGIGLVVFAIRVGLQLSNPRPTLTVNKSIVALGTELRVDWSIEGRVERLTRCCITLEAREEATYTRGTDTVTDTNVFATIPLANQTPRGISGRGSARVTIPADTMHSFDARHNKIVWVIRVRGEVPRWPDSNDEFPLIVAPRDR